MITSAFEPLVSYDILIHEASQWGQGQGMHDPVLSHIWTVTSGKIWALSLQGLHSLMPCHLD